MTELKLETAQTSSQNQEAIDLAKQRHIENNPIDFGTILSVLDHKSVTLHDRRELSILYGMDVKEITAAIKGYAKNSELRNSLGIVPKDEYEFVDTLLEKWSTKMTFQGMFTIDTPYDIGDGVFATKEDLEGLSDKERIKVEYSDPKVLTMAELLPKIIFNNVKLGLKFNEKELTNAMDVWVTRRKNDIISDIMEKVAYESPVLEELAEPEWDRFIAAVTNTDREEAKIAMKHFIWQVKRKMFGLPVKYHMMVILFGAQEAGKSTVARDYLCSPVKDFFASVDFEDITDSRYHSIWSNYVLFLDEMGKSFVSNLEDIKRKITEDRFNSRILTKNSDTVVVNRATFIGTTNKDISRLIFDDTGMRRFYQIDCKSKLDWDVTQTVDYLKLWRSVDERKETPLLADQERLKRIKKIQNTKRQITMLEKWLRERSHQAFVEERVMSQAFYEEYVKFEKANNNDRCDMSITKFGRDIKDIAMQIPGLELVKKRLPGGYEFRVTYPGNVNSDQED